MDRTDQKMQDQDRTRTEQADVSTSASERFVVGTIRLTGGNNPSGQRGIRWTSDTQDNEGQGKKSSKLCCIFVGDESDESDAGETDDRRNAYERAPRSKKKHDPNCKHKQH